MLNIKNYNKWKEVCDDDELIKILYEEGIRPDTDEFKQLLGDSVNSGQEVDLKTKLILYFALFGIPIITIIAIHKIKKHFKKKKNNRKESE